MTDLPRLRRMLGGPHTAWLLEQARDRMETGRPLDTPTTLKAATAEQRRAVELLLGRRLRAGGSLTVPLAEVDRVLRSSLACPDGLAAAVVTLTGPVPDRRARAMAEADAWRQVWAQLDHPAVTGRPELTSWRAGIEASGLLKRLSGSDPGTARRLTAEAVRVLADLPAPGLTLPVFAARTVGDAHALDEGRPLTALVQSALRALAALPSEAPTGAEGRRAVWAAVGVALDELSSRVLTLGLPGSTGDITGRILAAARAGGEPCLLTLRQLTQQMVDLGLGGRAVRVCENPAVLAAAADALGAHCPPLVCVEGNLSVAARTLLIRLADQGSPPTMATSTGAASASPPPSSVCRAPLPGVTTPTPTWRRSQLVSAPRSRQAPRHRRHRTPRSVTPSAVTPSASRTSTSSTPCSTTSGAIPAADRRLFGEADRATPAGPGDRG